MSHTSHFAGGGKGQAIILEEKGAYMNSEFALGLAEKWGILDIIEREAGRYTKGKRKGQLRGRLEWLKIVRGGWSYRFGGVHKRGILCWRVVDTWNNKMYVCGERRKYTPIMDDFLDGK